MENETLNLSLASAWEKVWYYACVVIVAGLIFTINPSPYSAHSPTLNDLHFWILGVVGMNAIVLHWHFKNRNSLYDC